MSESIAVICAFVFAIAALTDLFTARIPNLLTYPAILIGLCVNTWLFGLTGFTLSFLGLLFAAAPFLLAFAYGGGGGGDVKIMAAAGALLAIPAILPVMAYALIIGAFMGAFLVVVRGPFLKSATALFHRPKEPVTPLKDPAPLPKSPQPGVRFGIALALGFAWAKTPGLWQIPGL